MMERLRSPSSVSAWLVLAGIALFAAPRAADAQTLPTSDDCRDCHLGLADERLSAPAVSYESDVHAETGFGCLACHGSGGFDRLDPAAGFLAAPERREIPEMCGRCHSDAAFMRQFNPGLRVDQVSEYWTSVHGQRLREFDDPLVATCVDCHPAHEIRPPSDTESPVYPGNIVETCSRCHSDTARMAGYDIRTDQADEYRTSVHGRLLFEEGDVSAPVCNDCHGNHGAAPPGLASVRNVCGQCHSVMADYFDQSAHGEIFNENDLPGCATCHDHHAIDPVSDETLHVRTEDVCATCHFPPDTLGLEFERMASVLDSLELAHEASLQILEDAESRGMEVSQALFELEDIGNARTRAHSAIHTFRAQSVRQEVEEGFAITARADERGEAALEEYHFRRIGLGVSSGIIALLIIGLLLKIREAEDRMEELIKQVETFYGRTLASGERRKATRAQIRLATSALMLEVCHADGELTPVEREYLERLARERFELDDPEAERLIELAERERERGAPGRLERLAEMIAGQFSLERKWFLMDELWALVCVDGEASPEEVAVMEKVGYLLDVGPADSAAARERGAATVGYEPPDEETT
jgi:predicted CXXCH cytochrome family protein